MQTKDFAAAVADFSYTEEEKIAEETLRREFWERFPAANLSSMTQEQYCLGLEPKENSFCYWLEFKTRRLGGMGGGTAYKFIIFFSQEQREYVFSGKYSTAEQAFSTVKSGLLGLLRLGGEGKFEECERVAPFESAVLVRGKALNMYFPEQFLPIFSLEHLKDLCLQFGVNANFESQIAMNLALLVFKRQNPLVGSWTNDKFASFIYAKFPPFTQFWKIPPGENARLWKECLSQKFICVGWNEIGDVRQETDLKAFREKYRDIYGANRVRYSKEIWQFAKEIKKGDTVIANNGLGSIVGVGTVTGDYWYDQTRQEYKHCIPVDWTITKEFPVPESARELAKTWFQGTVKKISREDYNKLPANEAEGGESNGDLSTGTSVVVPSKSRYSAICNATFLPEKFFADCEQLLANKKQLILQGAPGTGKTFVAEHLAALWAGDKARVKVVQFHESYGYEDFVHGIKPLSTPDSERTVFALMDGTFLKFCEVVSNDPSNRYVLLIDEINRAKTARVFGELLYLLEYRGKIVELQNGKPFSIPTNLYIIGTMNTTDKSIALVDYALRRRFAFIDLTPVKNGRSVVLRKWLDANGIENAGEVDDLFVALNKAIAEKDEALMVGHSYFMQPQALDEKRFSPQLLEFVWNYYILPLIAEYEYELSRSALEQKYGLTALQQ